MKRIPLMICTLLLTACASTGAGRGEYQGPDAGVAVAGMGSPAKSPYQSYTLLYRKVGVKDPAAMEKGRFTFFHSSLFSSQKKDYDNSQEKGAVLSAALSPGRYEIYDFEVFYNAGTRQMTYRSRTPFSIPFTVTPGKVTYLGSYQAHTLYNKIFRIPFPAGAVFVVEDRRESDLRLLKERQANLPSEIVNAAPVPAKLGSPYFVSSPPPQ